MNETEHWFSGYTLGRDDLGVWSPEGDWYEVEEIPDVINALTSERDEAVASRDAWARMATEEAKRCLDNGVAKNKAISERDEAVREAAELRAALGRVRQTIQLSSSAMAFTIGKIIDASLTPDKAAPGAKDGEA